MSDEETEDISDLQQWFAVDSCGDIEFYETEEQARGAAEDALEVERECADEGWSEAVTNIGYGYMVGYVREKPGSFRELDDEERTIHGCDNVIDYEVYSPKDSDPRHSETK